MPQRDPLSPAGRLERALLAADAWLDTARYRLRRWFADGWEWLCDALAPLRVRGFTRLGVEVFSEGFTHAAAAAVVLLALAIPAMKATEGDWLASIGYAVEFQDRYGTPIGRRGLAFDDSLPLSAYPEHFIEAVLATEDRRFYSHFGIDVFGTIRAVLTNVAAGAVVQGGSTITQQLAKMLFLTNDRTIERKIPEAFLALWLETHLTKDEILKLYLDRSYMGGGNFGVAAAAEFYFGKSVTDLTLPESAMLAGLFKAPSRYAPHVNLPAARARANEVLTNLVQAGLMTEGQVAAARRTPASVVPREFAAAPDYYLDWAFEEVKRLAESGSSVLIVRTTFDPVLQLQAEAAIESTLRQYGDSYGVSQAAVVLQEPDGAVRAMVGGRDYGESQFNRAVQARRQPGSAFKPFVYTAALMNGYTRTMTVIDGPVRVGDWSPRNYAGGYSGAMSLTTAVARSINTIPVKITEDIGRDTVIATAQAMGIRTPLTPVPSLPLGAEEVSVLDMANAYATLAAGGVYVQSWAVMEIRSADGTILYSHDRDAPAPEQVVPLTVAEDMNRMLATVVTSGTGTRARISGVAVAGKTGTTTSNRDAWFVGYSGNYVAAVWFGNDDYSVTSSSLTGGTVPAIAWQALMQSAHAGVQLAALPGVSEGGPGPRLASTSPMAGGNVTAFRDTSTLRPEALGVLADMATRLTDLPVPGPVLTAGIPQPDTPPVETVAAIFALRPEMADGAE